MDAQAIGKTLKDLRLSSGLSREKVCEELGVGLSALAMYERGERIPRDEIKLRIARLYGKSVDDIFYAQESTLSAQQ